MPAERRSVREIVLVVLALLSALPFPIAVFVALYIAGGADSGWGETPRSEAIATTSLFVMLPVLQIVGPLLGLLMWKSWSYTARLVCVLLPIIYLALLPMLLDSVEDIWGGAG
jgi:hypothetical protein